MGLRSAAISSARRMAAASLGKPYRLRISASRLRSWTVRENMRGFVVVFGMPVIVPHWYIVSSARLLESFPLPAG